MYALAYKFFWFLKLQYHQQFRLHSICYILNSRYYIFRIIDEDSHRELYVDSACSSGEVVWRMTKTLVTLRFQKASPFTVCFSSKAPVGYEKFGVYSFSLNNLFVGNPNIGTFL